MPSQTKILPVLLIGLIVGLDAPRLLAEGTTESWNIRVAALDIVPGHDTLWLRTGQGKEPVQIFLNTRIFSQSTEHKGPAKLVFYRSAAEATAEEPPPPIASTVLSSKSSLLVFSPRSDGKSYRAFVTSDDDFPFGSFRLVNFSKAAVRAELGGKTLFLKPGAAGTCKFRKAETAIPVRIQAMAKGKPARLVRQSSWSIIPSQRELVLLFPNPKNGLVRLHHFVDTKPQKPPE